ncbi:MAG: hypothetical protein HUK08_00440 [Bacteroidaceae bacterium]|nr:hypothetical protein [Bacteroidaceae bacterium]
MNMKLGKGRSMDVLDPCAMLMMIFAEVEYGDELSFRRYSQQEEDDNAYHKESIYDETIWY